MVRTIGRSSKPSGPLTPRNSHLVGSSSATSLVLGGTGYRLIYGVTCYCGFHSRTVTNSKNCWSPSQPVTIGPRSLGGSRGRRRSRRPSSSRNSQYQVKKHSPLSVPSGFTVFTQHTYPLPPCRVLKSGGRSYGAFFIATLRFLWFFYP